MIEETVGNQMKKLTIATGTPIISPSTSSVGQGEPDGAPPAERAPSSATTGAASVAKRQRRAYEPKMATFCFWMLATSEFTSFGLLRNDCSDGIITVEAKSGRVSRSMYCAMCLAFAIRSAAFFCSAL